MARDWSDLWGLSQPRDRTGLQATSVRHTCGRLISLRDISSPQENVRMDWRTLTFLIILKFDMLPSHDCLTPALVRAGLCSEDPV